MKNWQITALEKLELNLATELLPQGHVKIRITRAGLGDTDIMLYKNKQTKYPITPCRHAVGVVSELIESESSLQKGDIVVLDPYLPCNECYSCKTDDFMYCNHMDIYGWNKDGFLKDFVTVPLENVKKLPENVKSEDAVFLEYIAIALRMLDSIDLQKGEHIVIVGAGILGNILAQLIIYYQAIPIMIDNNAKNLEIAKNSGVYYLLSEDKDIGKNINDITGGRLARYAIYISGTETDLSSAFKYVSNGGTVGITGLVAPKMKASLDIALAKQLTVKTVKSGYGNIDSAINTLATKIVDLSLLTNKVFKYTDVPLAFEEFKDEKLDSIFQIIIDCLAE